MEWFHDLIGRSTDNISWLQMSLRGALIFVYAMILVRFGGFRAFGMYSSFDIVLGVVLGSTLSRALTNNSPFFSTLAASTVLVLLHRLLARLALDHPRLERLVKGRDIRLVHDGRPERAAMRRANISRGDLAEALRSDGGIQDVGEVREARLERSGRISVIPKD